MKALLLALALAFCAACSTETRGGPGGELREFTGSHTRVVWVQQDGRDPYAAGDNLQLMGLDSNDGRGERPLLPARGSYVKPLLTPSGARIVFSRRPTRPEGPEAFAVNWDGSGLTSLGRGFALAVWANPTDGREWVYVGTDNKKGQEYDFATVSRMPIDAPQAREVVWNKTLVSGDTFQVSSDGRHAGGLFPWPEAGVAELPNGSLRKLGDGCWTAMSSVRGPVMWYFDGSHRNLTLVDIRSDKRWMVNINRVPGFGNDEVYHPRWTNHPRFLAMSGPYNLGGANQVRSGGAQTEVYVGRFAPDYTRVEAWLRVTSNASGDSYPDIWIERRNNPHEVAPKSGSIGGSAAASDASRPNAPASDAAGRLVVEAKLTKSGDIPSPQAIAPYQHALVVNTYEILKTIQGSYSGRTVLVAQWAIRDRRVLPTARKTTGSVHTLTLERYDAHPELEGERLISAGDAPDLPLYYEVAGSPSTSELPPKGAFPPEGRSH
jgi:hypothetical protein